MLDKLVKELTAFALAQRAIEKEEDALRPMPALKLLTR